MYLNNDETNGSDCNVVRLSLYDYTIALRCFREIRRGGLNVVLILNHTLVIYCMQAAFS